ncbi:hypothetical protein [Actinomadura oligospora]|uniref:hypothetical protein n=1 Tax=Actinomadura oligospora TaxID=111804 RepID=UPI0012F8FE5C|nr:hypothetical protein [Actinomadura oligospora]
MTLDDDYTPGTSGPLQQRVIEVIVNEVGAGPRSLAIARVNEVFDIWREAARERARETAQQRFAGLMPGVTGVARRTKSPTRSLLRPSTSPRNEGDDFHEHHGRAQG